MDLRALLSERNAQINTLHDIQSVSPPGMDKPAERLIREKQFRVRVPSYSSHYFRNQFLLLRYCITILDSLYLIHLIKIKFKNYFYKLFNYF